MRVVVDASDTMVSFGEVAVWSFELSAWGECAQAADENAALARFAARVDLSLSDLEVVERIMGPEAAFAADLLPVDDAQIARTIDILDAQRESTLRLFESVPDEALDDENAGVRQPAWMTWRTPRAILRHIVDTESRAYPRWCGLPQLGPIDDLGEELGCSALHIREVVRCMPREFRAEHQGETWTPVKLLRRLAWHERVEAVFLRRRLESLSGG